MKWPFFPSIRCSAAAEDFPSVERAGTLENWIWKHISLRKRKPNNNRSPLWRNSSGIFGKDWKTQDSSGIIYHIRSAIMTRWLSLPRTTPAGMELLSRGTDPGDRAALIYAINKQNKEISFPVRIQTKKLRPNSNETAINKKYKFPNRTNFVEFWKFHHFKSVL